MAFHNTGNNLEEEVGTTEQPVRLILGFHGGFYCQFQNLEVTYDIYL